MLLSRKFCRLAIIIFHDCRRKKFIWRTTMEGDNLLGIYPLPFAVLEKTLAPHLDSSASWVGVRRCEIYIHEFLYVVQYSVQLYLHFHKGL